MGAAAGVGEPGGGRLATTGQGGSGGLEWRRTAGRPTLLNRAAVANGSLRILSLVDVSGWAWRAEFQLTPEFGSSTGAPIMTQCWILMDGTVAWGAA